MTKREKAIAETKAQLEAHREFQRFYIELAQACPTLPADEVIALGDRLMELVAALPPKKRQREEYDALMHSVNELVLPHGWVMDPRARRAQSISKWGDLPVSPITIPELVPGDEAGG